MIELLGCRRFENGAGRARREAALSLLVGNPASTAATHGAGPAVFDRRISDPGH